MIVTNMLALGTLALMLAFGGACPPARAQSANSPAAPSSATSSSQSQQPPPPDHGDDTSGSSSSRKAHSKTAHHVRVEEEDPTAPELAHAEALIQQHSYSSAEPLLRKVVAADSTNYVAWFDLGFVENNLGKIDDSIAAYRNSVAAKPGVFESNLNLGLQLAKTNPAEATSFLRAATQLTPTSHPSEGKARAWLSLAHVLEAANPDEAIAAYKEAAALQPKDPEPHVAAGLLLEK
jgi:tetratricopeptide (TPR) repeat protein